jgi:hypothetical protein
MFSNNDAVDAVVVSTIAADAVAINAVATNSVVANIVAAIAVDTAVNTAAADAIAADAVATITTEAITVNAVAVSAVAVHAIAVDAFTAVEVDTVATNTIAVNAMAAAAVKTDDDATFESHHLDQQSVSCDHADISPSEQSVMSVDHPQIALWQNQPECLKQLSLINSLRNYCKDMSAQLGVSRSENVKVLDSSNISNLEYDSFVEHSFSTKHDTMSDLRKMNLRDAGCTKDCLATDARDNGNTDDAQGTLLIQSHTAYAGAANKAQDVARI